MEHNAETLRPRLDGWAEMLKDYLDSEGDSLVVPITMADARAILSLLQESSEAISFPDPSEIL